jgi:CRISPR-associated protein (TIGR02584 family)
LPMQAGVGYCFIANQNLKHKRHDPMNKRVFLMITGLSPQIITETLYAYYVGTGLDDSIPTEVHLITTTEGSERAGLTLLEPVTGQFHKLLDAYSINNLSFTEDHIHVLTDAHSERLRDIRTPEDNTAAANFICEWVKKFTLDDDTQLMVSIAGGRKTMGYYAGYALTLFGRHQDQLSHVLVSQEYEGHRDFFFPTLHTEIVYSNTNKPLDTSKAKVTLAQIPFVRLRQELPKNSLVARLGFEDTVSLINTSPDDLSVALDVANCTVFVGPNAVHLERIDFCFYLWFVERLLSDTGPVIKPYDHDPDRALAEVFLGVIDRHGMTMLISNRTLDALNKGMDGGFFSSKRTRINTQLSKALGLSVGTKVHIQTFGSRGKSTYGLNLLAESVTVI